MTEHLRWPLEALWQSLAPRMPGFTAELLPSVDSTNSECMRRLRAGQHEPLLLVALAQTAGRGRMGRSWQSEGQAAGASLTFSLALPMAPRSWSGLSLAVGLSVADSLQAELARRWAAARRALRSNGPTICGCRGRAPSASWAAFWWKPRAGWRRARPAAQCAGWWWAWASMWRRAMAPISPHRPAACTSLMRAGMRPPPWGVSWSPW
ncbi:MAG: hypothetical protein V9G23_09860 [Giesbergeria sp.]